MTNPLIVPLNRPQYVPIGEVLVSELARRALSWTPSAQGPESEADELPELTKSYSGITDPNAPRRFSARQGAKGAVSVAPSNAEQATWFASALRQAGLQTDAPDDVLTQALVEAATGLRSEQGKGDSASPMSRNLALSQNLRGVLGAPRPPDMGGILETMHTMGRHADSSSLSVESMGARWIQAAAARTTEDPVLRALDAALGQYAALDKYREKATDGEEPDNSGLGADRWSRYAQKDTPFSWLRDSWGKLTDDSWVVAIPPRVWADWCSMVLRMGLAFGFLWECRWYEVVGRSLLMQDKDPIDIATHMSTPLLPWPGKRLPVASRNVKPIIKLTASRAVATRAAMLAHDKAHGDGWQSADSVEEAIRHLRRCRISVSEPGHQDFRDNIRTALSGRVWNRSTNNVYETILYSLQQRSSHVLSEDYYGFLRPRGGRYSIVAPGTEWIAVMASLATDRPGGETHLGKVLSSLAQLGVRPELQELVELLESAGLARGSADADHGVRVKGAF